MSGSLPNPRSAFCNGWLLLRDRSVTGDATNNVRVFHVCAGVQPAELCEHFIDSQISVRTLNRDRVVDTGHSMHSPALATSKG